ncbi:hypothetical protein GCM10010123_26880 [Pilimelia anulata]|uniref:ESAT-6-like protein n=1 Tax=Pilimelia anulata TaxID=53371 RepID=A0A8J3F9Y1_9ACTN|nr:hypothetical protein GCM10010123_26880 [Pilimelia anulata]
MQEASAHIQAALNTLDSLLGQLEGDAAPLVATWSGAARAAYDERQRAWRTASEDLAATLRDIRLAVDESAADYLATEQRNRALFE